MLYLSQLLGVPLEDAQGERKGRLSDVLAPLEEVGQPGASYPSALLVESDTDDDQHWRVPLQAVELRDGDLYLLVPDEQLEIYTEHAQERPEIRLGRDVLDKQVIDVVRKKAVRVNDICFASDWQILGIDNSTLGIVRRLTPSWLLGARTPTLIPWERIELIGVQQPHEVDEGTEEETPSSTTGLPRTASGHLAELLYPADIADIVHQLSPFQGARVIENLDDDTAAATMEEIDTDRQRHILENIKPERAADILQTMGPDEAADLLAKLPEERAQELLRLMTPEESEDVQELMEYEADTAGGLMTTDYIVLNQGRTVAEALMMVRQNIQENDVRIAYAYCVEDETCDECRVLGVLSLWDLLVADQEQRLQDLMETDIISVQPDVPARTVAETIAKYNLLAVPVINEEGLLEGVVTVDDALDVLLPPESRRKPTRMY